MKNQTKLLFLALFSLYTLLLKAQDEYKFMVYIPSGEFIMGKDSKDETDYSPAHKVKIKGFYMDIHEVTNAEYLKFCEATDRNLPEFWGIDKYKSGENYPDCPVIGVNYSDAKAYAEWVGKRLPTEAEWEYAARGGLAGETFPTGSDVEDYPAELWNGDDTRRLFPVMKRKPNGYGLYDMAGSVREWVLDYYQYEFYKNSPSDNPQGPEKGKFRVTRGGGWKSGKMCKTVYGRSAIPSGWVDICVGFRCVKDAN